MVCVIRAQYTDHSLGDVRVCTLCFALCDATQLVMQVALLHAETWD